MKLFSFEFGT
jgi:hypothetical protein